MGIDSSSIHLFFKACEDEFKKNVEKQNKKVSSYIRQIEKKIKENKIKIDQNYLKELERVLKQSYKIEDSEFNEILNIKTEEIMVNIINIPLTEGKFRKKKAEILRAKHNNKEYETRIMMGIEKLKKINLAFIMNKYDKNIRQILLDLDDLNIMLKKEYEKIVTEILYKEYPLNYQNESMKSLFAKKESVTKEMLREYNVANVQKLEVLSEILKSKNATELLVKKVEKFKVDEPLMTNIYEILHNEKLENREKQIGIEKVCLEYDLNWFRQELKNSVETRSIILHDIYRSLDHGLKLVLQPYIKNNCFSLIKLYKKTVEQNQSLEEKSKGLMQLKGIIVLIILGNDKIISTSFKIIIDLIRNSSENMEINRTELVFKL